MKSVALILLLLAPVITQAQVPTFDAATNVLTLPVLEIGKQTVSNIKLRLDAITVVAIDPPVAPVPGIAEVCTDDFFTQDTLRKLQAYEGKVVTDPQVLINAVGCQPSSNKAVGTDIALKWTSSQSSKSFTVITVGHVASIH